MDEVFLKSKWWLPLVESLVLLPQNSAQLICRASLLPVDDGEVLGPKVGLPLASDL